MACVWRLSSQATVSASCSRCSARSVMSAKLPMGVATMYKGGGVYCCAAAASRAAPRAEAKEALNEIPRIPWKETTGSSARTGPCAPQRTHCQRARPGRRGPGPGPSASRRSATGGAQLSDARARRRRDRPGAARPGPHPGVRRSAQPHPRRLWPGRRGRGGGEIDLVLRDRDRTLVFVEVRNRTHGAFGGAGGSIGATKQRRIIFAAQHYLRRLPAPPPCRFDVVLVQEQEPVQWIKAAFDAQ